MKKLDKINKRILFELDKNARIPETQLAKLVGKSKESIRYRIKKLEEEQIIQGFSIWIDPVRIGYKPAKFYLNIANIPSKRKELIDFVKKDKRLFWLGLAEGAWNIGLTFFVKSNKEFFELKKEIQSKFGELILEINTAAPVGVYVCDRTFLHQTTAEWKCIFGEEETHQIDDLDKQILKELFKNSRVSVVEIARNHNSTIDLVRNHMKKLEQKNIIFRYKVITNHNLLGYEFFKTFLYFNNLTKEDEIKLMEYAKQEPKIVHFLKQISSWDIELEIMCESYLEYNEIIQKLTEEFAKSIRKVETAIMSEDYVFPAEKMVFE
ncbi:MAG: Lrp/AsnC family transcriptional regulator [Candidatus Woesearchaeota archaeon]|jgi:DNA-binding Lrp family transcriptional regulator